MIPAALLDRMEIIELSGYTETEKIEIGRTFLIPRQLEAHGLSPKQIDLEDDALRKVVSEYTREAGVRNLERYVASTKRMSPPWDVTANPTATPAAPARSAISGRCGGGPRASATNAPSTRITAFGPSLAMRTALFRIA